MSQGSRPGDGLRLIPWRWWLRACSVAFARRSTGEQRGHAEGTALKVTIDSREPLADTLRVIGAVYGVTLVVAENGTSEKESTRQRTPTPRKRAGNTNQRTRSGLTDGGARRSRKGGPGESAGPPSNAEVRSWARANGLTISDRGRVPASVLTAFRDAHQ